MILPLLLYHRNKSSDSGITNNNNSDSGITKIAIVTLINIS